MSPRAAAAVAEARRVLDLSARHGLAFEYSADGWRIVDAEQLLANLPPMADELLVTA